MGIAVRAAAVMMAIGWLVGRECGRAVDLAVETLQGGDGHGCGGNGGGCDDASRDVSDT